MDLYAHPIMPHLTLNVVRLATLCYHMRKQKTLYTLLSLNPIHAFDLRET
jgi:hypothetical protein